MRISGQQYLIFDADDTLWENNIYFERAFGEFVGFLAHSSLSPAAVRSVLDEIELANAKTRGYGSLSFGRNLRQCYRRLAEREITDGDLDRVLSFATRILEAPVELIAGVRETLDALVLRHDLTLFTKGHPEEQKLKIDRSGLGVYFGHTAVVPEKNAGAYRRLVQERGLDPARTWMIGNSPRSDINPALEAGLNAVFVPHAHTWELEKTALRPAGPGRLIAVESFEELARFF